jgi:molybdopterin-guanine dinucleotide biosynthesis protein A
VTGATAVVLAGGKSSRMGTPKALLPFDDEPLIVHVVATLRNLFAKVVVVAAPGQELPAMPATVVRDDVAFQGPVGGLCYGLAAAGGEVSFVSSCDSAFLNLGLIAHLVSRISQHDVVVPYWQGRLQPLHAVYRRKVLPLLEDQLARGELRPVYLFDRVPTLKIEEDEIRRFDPDGSSFFNMNTPEDYVEAQRRWSDPGRRRGWAEPREAVCCVVELFGVARLLTKQTEVPLVLSPDATLSHLFAALAAKFPVLVGRVIRRDAAALVEGYACNVNGLTFVRCSSVRVSTGDRIVILSADAGG